MKWCHETFTLAFGSNTFLSMPRSFIIAGILPFQLRPAARCGLGNLRFLPRRDFVGFRKANGLEFVLWSFGTKERYFKNIFQNILLPGLKLCPPNIDCYFLETPKTTVFLRMAASASMNQWFDIGHDGKLPSQRNGLHVTRRPQEWWKMTPWIAGWHWMTLEIYTNLTTLEVAFEFANEDWKCRRMLWQILQRRMWGRTLRKLSSWSKKLQGMLFSSLTATRMKARTLWRISFWDWVYVGDSTTLCL